MIIIMVMVLIVMLMIMIMTIMVRIIIKPELLDAEADSDEISAESSNVTRKQSTNLETCARLQTELKLQIKTFASSAPSQCHLSQSRIRRPLGRSRIELVRASQEPLLILSLHIWRGGDI